MKYQIKYTSEFRKDYKRIFKRGLRIEKLNTIINILANGEQLDLKYKDHELMGIYKGYRECHIEPDWLLVYRIEKDTLILFLSRTGSHSDLF
ncbi:MAG: addiction module toxin, RelE/StbE family [Herbinix sp.]|jgi:mRNA interferase YafQ|nr:addiction module toxin, RelE/StbE family [Herbinix sp.]